MTNCGDTAELPSVGITCIVGSNNVGKSQLLRDIVSLLENRNIQPIVLIKADVSRSTPNPTLEEITSWLDTTSIRQPNQAGDTYTAMGGGQNLNAQTFFNSINQGDPSYLGPTRTFYCWYADAGSRVGLSGGSLGMGGMNPNPHPLARLFRDGELEERLSKLADDTFGFPLTLDRINGNVRLLVGRPDIVAPPIDRPTRDYADAVASLIPLEVQGDGVKSFMGLALHTMVGHQPMIIIDEPEAFLHQLQARALGRWIAIESQSRQRQVILATHSRDIILGLLGRGADVTVLRLIRDGNSSRLKQLEPNDLDTIWNDPILRYSNVLDGLFFKYVVVCEADADCRFYGAVLDHLTEKDNVGINPDDVLFVPSGGKDRIPNIIRSLHVLGVETYAIVDFDTLKTKATCKKIIEAMGGSWDTINDDYVTMANALNSDGGTQWDQTKTQGIAAVPQGPASEAAKRLLAILRSKKLLIVPVGEIEGFDRTISGHGSEWVNTMLGRHGHESCSEAIDLISEIVRQV